LKEVFRRVAAGLPPVDIVVIAKPAAAKVGAAGLAAVTAMVGPAIVKAVRRVRPEERG
jgi:hypothetical protein